VPSQELRRFDPWSAVVIALTLVLFVVSVFVKGFTHELLLEAGVFLVSIKLIMMANRNNLSARLTVQRLEHISSILEDIQARSTKSQR
jgi:hypothetical protein